MAGVKGTRRRSGLRRSRNKNPIPKAIRNLQPEKPPRPRPAPSGVIAGRGLNDLGREIRRTKREISSADDVLFRIQTPGVDEFTVAEREDLEDCVLGPHAPARHGQE